jgi:aminoglycoside 3-N-acetyltransferase I
MNFDVAQYQIKRLGNQDVLILQKLIRLFQEVFEMGNPEVPGEFYLKSLLEKPGFIAFVAIRENEIAGGLTAYELPMYYAEYSEVFIYDVAVKSEFQRKGFGKELLLSLEKYCRQNGIREMFVESHEEDGHALDFYHSTGGRPEKVVQFNYSFDK